MGNIAWSIFFCSSLLILLSFLLLQ
uniref:Uncharacterized protein n=1 Tax=Rhizophora mucronata TaxID=61149 RepID=A0A2P2QWL1_RHIMU